MKHRLSITLLLIGMFLVTQLIGIGVISAYNSHSEGTLPSWIEPPKEVSPQISIIWIIVAIALGVGLMLLLISLKVEVSLRIWFFLVVVVAIALTLNTLFSLLAPALSFIIAICVALPLAFLKVFVRDIRLHNATELMIYPGIAALFVPLLNVWTVVLLLIVISLYDIYAVWHAGFMQKMAKYQIQKVRVFSGFFIPYLGAKEKASLGKSRSKKAQKVRVNVAILGGGDVVFPIILAGVVFVAFGFLSALIISLGATLALATLFYFSEKGKFYPAMPFISAGCFVALGLVYLLNLVI